MGGATVVSACLAAVLLETAFHRHRGGKWISKRLCGGILVWSDTQLRTIQLFL